MSLLNIPSSPQVSLALRSSSSSSFIKSSCGRKSELLLWKTPNEMLQNEHFTHCTKECVHCTATDAHLHTCSLFTTECTSNDEPATRKCSHCQEGTRHRHRLSNALQNANFTTTLQFDCTLLTVYIGTVLVDGAL